MDSSHQDRTHWPQSLLLVQLHHVIPGLFPSGHFGLSEPADLPNSIKNGSILFEGYQSAVAAWHWASMHNTRTLKPKQPNEIQTSLISSFAPVLVLLWHVKMFYVKLHVCSACCVGVQVPLISAVLCSSGSCSVSEVPSLLSRNLCCCIQLLTRRLCRRVRGTSASLEGCQKSHFIDFFFFFADFQRVSLAYRLHWTSLI